MKKVVILIFSSILFISCVPSETEKSRVLGNIMPLGDSLTFDEAYDDTRTDRERTSYRSHLWYLLNEGKYTANLVGSLKTGQAISPPFDPDTEGHSGFTSYDIAEHVYGYLSDFHPDIILLHIGTNDPGYNADGIQEILNEIDAYKKDANQTIKVIVALIIDLQNQDDYRTYIYNINIRKLVEYRINQGDEDITLVDMYRGAGLIRNDYRDRKHPKDSGYKKMANIWFDALINL